MRVSRAKHVVVYCAGGRCQIGRMGAVVDVAIGRDAGPEEIARGIAEALGGIGHRAGITLALPSEMCLCASVNGNGLPRGMKRQTLAFRLEEQMPIAAEESVADFAGAGEAVLGVCVDVRRVAPLVTALERQGLRIDRICPAAFLAVQEMMASDRAPVDIVLWHEADRVDLVAIRDRLPTAWYWLPATGSDIAARVRLLSVDSAFPLRIVAVGAPSSLLAELEVEGLSVTARPGQSILFAACVAAEAIVESGMGPWIDLRRDALAGERAARGAKAATVFAAAAMILFLFCLAASVFWRAHQYQQLAALYDAKEQALFQQTFPSQPIPASPRSRMVSEERRLRQESGPADMRQAGSVLRLLHESLSSLPSDVLYRVIEMRISDNKFSLDGQAKTHADADAVAAALRGGGHVRVEMPRSEQIAGMSGAAVNFTLTATIEPGNQTSKVIAPVSVSSKAPKLGGVR